MSTANSNTTPSPYLRTKVLTASAEELRIMLYDGAIKFCRQARHALEKRELEPMYNAIVRAQQIVSELSSSLDHTTNPQLCQKLAGLYNYIYLRLVDANMERDTAHLDEAIRLLEFQRETWTMALKKMRNSQDDSPGVAVPPSPGMRSSESPGSPAAQPAQEPPNPIATIGPARPVRPRDPFTPAPPPSSSFSVQG